MLDDLQKRTAEAIINIFETGAPLGDYGAVTLVAGDRGHLTYGRSQTTLASGNLFLLVKAYCDKAEAALGGALRGYLARLQPPDVSLDRDQGFRDLLRQAGGDPVMHMVQDAFFDRIYWTPAAQEADAMGIQRPLGVAVVYDGHVHGSFARLRDTTTHEIGEPSAVGEQAWIQGYVQRRKDWLKRSAPPLNRTTYRMATFERLIADGNWELGLPFTVLGREISLQTLQPPVRVSADAGGPRVLSVTEPPLTGPDVSVLQRLLRGKGLEVQETGSYDGQTESAVREFQRTVRTLVVDGIVGPATRAALQSGS
jgi:chitosanase